MVRVEKLIWDVWNKEHIALHGITVDEVEEVCKKPIAVYETYKGRFEIVGLTKKKKKIKVVSGQDREAKLYQIGSFYPITAFEEGK